MEKLKQTIEKDIYKIIQELKKCKNKNKYFKLINSCEYLTTIAFLKNIDIKIPKELEYELNKKNVDDIEVQYTNMLFENINIMYPYNKKLCNMLDKFDIDSYNRKDLNKKTNFNECLKLSKEFLKSYDKDIYKYFKKLINSANFFILDQTNDYVGMTYRSNYLINPYVYVSLNNNIIDYLSIVHEVVHAYIFDLQKYMSINEQSKDSINNLQEVYSMFIELVAMKYLNDIRYNNEELLCLKSNNDYSMIQCLLEFEDDIYGDFNYGLYTKDEAYAYGGVLAYHFYNQYRKKEEKTKDNILKFMLESKDHDKLYMLDNYGLNKNDIINSQKLKKCMKNLRKDMELK